MSFHDMSWQVVSVLTLGLILIGGGVLAFIASLIVEHREHQRSLRKFDARVGRDVWKDIKGITK